MEQINESEKPSDAVKYQIRRSLAHICNRNAGVEGITLITESGTVCFYDKEAASFVSTKWANKIPKVDMRHRMSVYQRSVYVLGTESQPVHMLQLTRSVTNLQFISVTQTRLSRRRIRPRSGNVFLPSHSAIIGCWRQKMIKPAGIYTIFILRCSMTSRSRLISA